jgi:hypothetical protein
MNSIGSAHAGLSRHPRRRFRVSTPDRILFIVGSLFSLLEAIRSLAQME